MSKTYSDPSRYPSGIFIESSLDLPATITGSFYTHAEYDAMLVVTNGYFANVTNEGVLSGFEGLHILFGGDVVNDGRIVGVSSVGVYLNDGGGVFNLVTGVITSQGSASAIYFGGSGSVSNAGEITGTTLYAIDLQSGGTVANTGTISSQSDNAILASGFTTISNEGLISGGGTKSGVVLEAGGWVANLDGGTIEGPRNNGVYVRGGATIGVYVSNAAGGLITGYHGVNIGGGGGTVVNAGVIVGAVDSAVALAHGGTITNQHGGTITSEGSQRGVYVAGAFGVVLNSGLIEASGSGGDAILLVDGGTVQNMTAGTITAPAGPAIHVAGLATLSNASLIMTASTLSAVVFSDGDTLSNLAGGMITAPSATAVYLTGTGAAIGTVLNAGSIIGGSDAGTVDGVDSMISGTVSNAQNGLISGTGFGVHITGAAATVINAGTIMASLTVVSGPPTGVDFGELTVGASLTNAVTGLISGVYAIRSHGDGTTLDNAGTLSGGYGGVYLGAGGAITNEAGGTIVGTGIVAGDQHASSYGEKIGGEVGTVVNGGTIEGRNDGIMMNTGGMLENDGTIGIIINVAGPSSADVYGGGTVATAILNTGRLVRSGRSLRPGAAAAISPASTAPSGFCWAAGFTSTMRERA